MDNNEIEFCTNIVSELVKLPCAQPFMNPIPTDEDETAGYYVKIKKPMHLNKIQEKLLTNSYKNFKEWEKDVNLIFTNTERFFGKDHARTYMAKELKKHFDKLMYADDFPERPRDWLAEVNEINQRVDKIMKKTPVEINKYWKHEITLKPLPEMKNDQIRNLIKASQLLTQKEDARAMFTLINQLNPEIKAHSEDVTLDIDVLSNKTHWALKWYIQKRLEEDGVAYPK